MEVVSQREFQVLAAIVERQQTTIESLTEKVLALEKQPTEWLIQSEANKLFIGRSGEPVDRHTFRKWILDWIKQGKLVEGYNLRSQSQGKFISKEFLKGSVDSKTKLKKVA